MYTAFASAAMTERMIGKLTFTNQQTGKGRVQLVDQLKLAKAKAFVIEVRREHILIDAMDQIWRRQKHELMKPLKVRMGMQEGEAGVDHGGISQEFFRCAFAEALDTDYGIMLYPLGFTRLVAKLIYRRFRNGPPNAHFMVSAWIIGTAL